MNSVLLWIGGLLVALLGLLFAVPYAVNWNSYRGVFEEEATRILGRKVQVGGAVNLRLLPVPYVRFEKLRISDTDATLGEPFFRAEAFTLWLAVAPLLRGSIEANEIELDRPVLRLAVDDSGRGNWQAISFNQGALPFVPSDVVLQSVRITNGTASLRVPGRPEPLSLSGVVGELSAGALTGPYRFRGDVQWDGRSREVRLATGAQEADGRLRFKLSVRELQSANTYSIDGALSELTGRARLEGSVAAKLPIAGLLAPLPQSARPGQRAEARGDAGSFDLQSKIAGDLSEIRLSDLAITFERDGKPQLVNGSGLVSWRSGQRTEIRLNSRWLDLDQIGIGDGAAPLVVARGLVHQLTAALPADGATLLSLDVDQVNFAAEAVGNLHLTVARAGGITSIGEFHAQLPGNARIDLRGTVSAATGDSFEGQISLLGASLQRFAAWAGGAELLARSGRGDSPFALTSRLEIGPDSINLGDASVELGAAQLQGSVGYGWGARKELRLGIDATTLDTSGIAPGILSLAGLTAQRPSSPPATTPAAPEEAKPAGAAEESPIADLTRRVRLIGEVIGNLGLRIRAAELTDGSASISNVDADLMLEGGTLRIAGLKFTTADGLRTDLQGTLANVASKPQGRIRGWLSADAPRGVGALARLLPSTEVLQADKLGETLPSAEIAFTAALGGAQAETLSVRADGMVDASRVSVSLTADGGISRWRQAPLELLARIDSPDLPLFLRRLSGEARGAARTAGAQSGSLLVKLTGPSAAALTSLAQLEASGLDARFSGRASIAEDGALGLDGELFVAARDARELAELAGFSPAPRIGALPVEGALAIARSGKVARIEPRGLGIGGSRITGRLEVASAGQRLRLEGRLAASEASIPHLIGLVLDGRVAAAADPLEAASPWPDVPFSLASLEGIDGRLVLTTPRLRLDRGLEVADAEAVIELEPGRLAISRLEGRTYGGKLSSSLLLQGTQAGATVTFEARITGARLDQASVAGASQGASAAGEANVALKLAGRALGPRALISTLSGSGEIELRNARFPGLSPAAIERAAEALIDGGGELSRAALERGLRAALSRDALALGSRKVAIEVADGALKVAPLVVDAPEGRVRNVTTVDLTTLRIDSEWQISSAASPRRPREGAAPAQVKGPLPPVTLVYVGPLGGLAGIEPRFSVDALESEITARKMERDLERLEQMRRHDEDRARQDAERLRRLDEGARGPGAGQVAPPYIIYAPLPIGGATRTPPAPGGSGDPGSVGPRGGGVGANPGVPPAPRSPAPPGAPRSLEQQLLTPR